jgi:hypothetical protein
LAQRRSKLRPRLHAIGRRDIDDAAAVLSLHGAHFVLHAQDHAENIGVERRGEALRSLGRNQAAIAFRGGVVHRIIEPAEPRHSLVHQGADVVLLTHVGVDEFGLRLDGL